MAGKPAVFTDVVDKGRFLLNGRGIARANINRSVRIREDYFALVYRR